MDLTRTIFECLDKSLSQAKKQRKHQYTSIILPNCMFYCDDTTQVNGIIEQ